MFQEMVAMHRYADKSIASYYRRFQRVMRVALPQLQEGDIRRSVVPVLARGSGSEKLALRLFAIQNPTLLLMAEVVESYVLVQEQM